ncbi:MAG: glycosyltransferase family 9 protein [Sedimentisphaerales bacterium]
MKILMFFSSGLGDTLFVAPTVLALRDIYPSAYIAAVVPHIRFNRFLLEDVLKFDDVIHLKRLRSLSPLAAIHYLKDFYRLCTSIRKQKFDMAILTIQACLPDEYVVAIASGAKDRIGPKFWRQQKNKFRFLLTKQAVSDYNEHLINMHFNLVRCLDDSLKAEKYVNKLNQALIKASLPSNFIPLTGKLMLILPGSGSQSYKRWPFKNFVNVIETVLGSGNCDVAIVSAPNEYDPSIISATVRENKKFHDLADSLTISQIIDLLTKTSLVLSNDNGLLHLAEFLNVPTITIYPGEWKYVSRRYFDNDTKHIVLPKKNQDPIAEYMLKHIWRTKKIHNLCQEIVNSVHPADVIAGIHNTTLLK